MGNLGTVRAKEKAEEVGREDTCLPIPCTALGDLSSCGARAVVKADLACSTRVFESDCNCLKS